jgi:hypothetical protein
MMISPKFVIPAQAGIQTMSNQLTKPDSRFHGMTKRDDFGFFHNFISYQQKSVEKSA